MNESDRDAVETPVVGVLVGSPSSEPTKMIPGLTGKTIRTGSPFRPSSNRPIADGGEGVGLAAADEMQADGFVGDQSPLVSGYVPVMGGAAEFEAGVVSATARGGVLASWLVLPFAIGSAVWFPFGGLMIGLLGSLLGAFGLTSKKTIWAMGGLLLNASLAGLCYWELI